MNQAKVKFFKQQLRQTPTDVDKLDILDRLTSELIYTDVELSKSLLEEQLTIAQKLKNRIQEAKAIHRRGFIKNSIYYYESALQDLHLAENILVPLEHKKLLAELYVDMTGTYMNIKNNKGAIEYLNKAKAFLNQINSATLKARILCREGYLKTRKGEDKEAAILLLDAEKILFEINERSIDDNYFLSLVYSGLGWVYYRIENFKESIKYYKSTIEICEKYKIYSRLTWHYLHLGDTYSAAGNYDTAIYYFKKIINEEHEDKSRYTKAGAYGNLGQIYAAQRRFDDALKMFDIAEEIYHQESGLDDDYNFAALERNIALLFAEIGDNENALKYFLSAIEFAEKYNDQQQCSVIYRDMAIFFEKQQDFKQAYNYQLSYSQAREKLINEEKARAFSELQIKYEAEKKERMAQIFRLQATELQLKALRAQMNPHFIFNCLNSIQKYISENDSNAAELYLSKFARLIRTILENSEQKAISLEEEINFLMDYLALEQVRFRDEFTYSIKVNPEIEEDIMGVPPMVIQPYIENAILHGVRDVENGKISIDFSLKDEQTILCVVEDNGIGRDKALKRVSSEKAHRSLGTIVTLQRLKLLKDSEEGELLVETIDKKDEKNKPTGTRVNIQIPLLSLLKQI